MSGRRDQQDPRLAAAAEVVIDEGGELMPDLEVEADDEPTYEPSLDERRELARMLAERARREAAAKQSLAARATARPKSAKEALEAARRAEQEKRELARLAAEEARRETQRRQAEARRAAEREARQARAAEEQAERDRQAAFQPRSATAPNRHPAHERATPITSPLDALLVEGRVTALLETLGEDVSVMETYVKFPPAVVVPLWRAHAVRARHDGDLTTTLAAEAVHEALQHRPGAVVAAKVAFGGREWAVWLDTSREHVLAALEPAELYLVGC